jgi:hypothetical protein
VNLKEAEDKDEDKNIVDAKAPFHQISTDIFNSSFLGFLV